MVRRLFASNLQTNNVAGLAAALATRVQSGRTLAEMSGLGSYFFYPYPQFLGSASGAGMIVIDSNDESRYKALQVQVERRHSAGYVSVAYTLAKSEDTRSFDPAFTTAATGSSQSASSTPFDIFNRDLNWALSDFDRRHVLQGSFSLELPFGQGRRFAGNASGVLERIVSGWNLAGAVTWQSGRPFTVYAGSNTLSNTVQTPANCNGCDPHMGSVFKAEGTGYVWLFDDTDLAKFSIPGPGEFSNVGRNYFITAPAFNVNFSLGKRTRIIGGQTLEIRMDATNFLNQVMFSTAPTAVITSTTFGRIAAPGSGAASSASRKISWG
ncbi:MAG: hypothetical protein EHM13_14755 [Acidobacteria bacterium]|nr:MAG: hypothetical protein EHM13_14755 [Acidobacteriota bacterium]